MSENEALSEKEKSARHYVIIGVPVHRTIEAPCSEMLGFAKALLPRMGVRVGLIQRTGESLIQRGRNRIARHFLATEATHLMFIDSDINFDPASIVAMLETGYELVGGPYPLKRIDWEAIGDAARRGVPDEELCHHAARYVMRPAGEFGDKFEIDERLCVEVREMGTGFMLIARSVFEKMIAAGTESYNDELDGRTYNFFECPVRSDRLLSEDWFFCHRAKELGIAPMLKLDVVLGHIGTYEFRGYITKTFTPVEAA